MLSFAVGDSLDGGLLMTSAGSYIGRDADGYEPLMSNKGIGLQTVIFGLGQMSFA